MSNWLIEFEFLRPWWLLLIPLSIIAVLQMLRRQSRGGWHQTLSAEKLAALTPSCAAGASSVSTQLDSTNSALSTVPAKVKPMRSNVMPWILIAAITTALLALAGPTWQATQNPLASQRQAMVILFDLSPSMLAQDLKPDRLSRARLKVIDLLRARTEGETALIVYAGDAHRIAPLSDDPATVEALVHTLHPEIMPIAGSQTEAAVSLALEMFRGADLEQGDLLLVTDGLHPTAVKNIVDTLPSNFRLSVLGVGSTGGAAIPVQPNGFLVDDSGSTVISQLDEASLQKLVQQFAGHYTRLSDDDSDIKAIEALASKPHEYHLFNNTLTTSAAAYDSKHDAGYWLVLALLPLAALAFRKHVLWTVVLWACTLTTLAPLTLLPSHAQANELATRWQWLWLNDNQQAMQALHNGDAEAAVQLFSDPTWKAIAMYRNGDYEKAAQLMRQSIQGDKDDSSSAVSAKRFVTTDDFYNFGNALAMSGQFEAAIQAYEYALGLNPENDDARHNLAIVLQTIPKEQNAEEDDKQGGASAGESNQQSSSDDASGNNSEESKNGAAQQSGSALGSGQNVDQSAISGDSVTANRNTQLNSADPEQTVELGQPEDTPLSQASPALNKTQSNDEQSADGLLGKHADGRTLNPYSEQWLKNLADDPGGYLRRKLQYQSQMRLKQNNGEPPELEQVRY